MSKSRGIFINILYNVFLKFELTVVVLLGVGTFTLQRGCISLALSFAIEQINQSLIADEQVQGLIEIAAKL